MVHKKSKKKFLCGLTINLKTKRNYQIKSYQGNCKTQIEYLKTWYHETS